MAKFLQPLYVSLILSLDEKWKPERVRENVWYEVVGDWATTQTTRTGQVREVTHFGILNDSLGLTWIPEYNCNVITEKRLLAARSAGVGAANPDCLYGLTVSGGKF